MTRAQIHPMAIVEPGAKIGKNVTIEPFAVVKENVTLEENVIVKSHAYIDGFTTIGSGTVIWPFAAVGTMTQDLKYKGEKTYVEIGKNCNIREYCTIRSSTQEGSVVSVGDNSLLMAYCHVAHNCTVGNNVILSCNSLLAGHVTIEDFAIIGGMTPIHQFVRIGCHAMVGGMSRIIKDVPPFTIGCGIPYLLAGINRIGLKRRAFSFETRRALSTAFRLLYRSNLHVEQALKKIETTIEQLPEIVHLVEFCRGSQRGLIGQEGTRLSVKSREVEKEAPVSKEGAAELALDLIRR